MNGCEIWQAEIEAYLDGELDASSRTDFEAHLPGCQNCTSALEAKRWLGDQLAALPQAEASPQFEAHFWARVAREADTTASGVQKFLTGLRTQWAIPATLVAVLSLWFSLGGPEQTERVSELAPALAPSDWEMLTDTEEFELLESDELELFALLDVLEDWDGSEEI